MCEAHVNPQSVTNIYNIYTNFSDGIFPIYDILLYISGTNSLDIMHATSSNWDGNLIEISHAATIGTVIYTTFNIWLFIASFILLLVMVGSIIITITPGSGKNPSKEWGISSMVERLFYTQNVKGSNPLLLITQLKIP